MQCNEGPEVRVTLGTPLGASSLELPTASRQALFAFARTVVEAAFLFSLRSSKQTFSHRCLIFRQCTEPQTKIHRNIELSKHQNTKSSKHGNIDLSGCCIKHTHTSIHPSIHTQHTPMMSGSK